jgi:hypothetical protein
MSEEETILAEAVAESVVHQVENTETSNIQEEVKKKDETPAWAEKRLNRITAQKYAARAEAEAARREADDLRARLATYERKSETENEYQNHLKDSDIHVLAEKLAEQKFIARQFDEKANAIVKSGEREFKSDFSSAVKSLQSVGALFNDNGSPTSFLESVMECDEPHKIIHFFGSNPEEAEDLLSLSPRAQARAITKIIC